MATYQGTCRCQNCGATVHVSTNRNGLAYYKCAPCQFKGEHFSMRSSQKFLATIEKHIDPDDAPAKPEKSGNVPEPVPPAKPKKAGFFDGLGV